MITIKSPREVEVMAEAGRILAETLALVASQARPGVSTEDLDAAAEEFIRSHPGATPSFKGLYDFPKSLCTQGNERIVDDVSVRGQSPVVQGEIDYILVTIYGIPLIREIEFRRHMAVQGHIPDSRKQ